ncbi:F-box/kelch-repeat protein SKIP25 [Coffea arabica]|uniref:F-box/kelch-repeat protein SKIP25 n=1 Tax=Coffea arabica TaxID=13443 RepID=A0A6P6VWB4_COFAR|nr:F-box/kelch-repeat protein SKIP25-like [Coffea arabica]
MNAPTGVCKRQDRSKTDDNHQTHDEDQMALIPGLPNHLAHLCLSALCPSLLNSVCQSWRRFIYSPSFPPFFSLYALLSSTSSTSNSVEFFCFDPISLAWESLPSPPSNPPLKLLHRHSSFISRILPIQSLTVSGRLVLIAATNDKFLPAFHRPLGFDPLSNKWFFGPPLLTPRRWCITGSADGAIYVVSGVGSNYRGDVARSVEKWDMKKKETEWNWQQMAALKDGRYSREAVEAVGYNGKLCIVNVKGNAIKEAAAYNIMTNQWEVMPEGMRGGWNGPTATDDGGLMYVVDETTGVLSRYTSESDHWEELIESEFLKGADQIAAGRGRVCAVCADGARIAVVDVVDKPARIWIVNPPPKMEAVAVHILPRMIRPDYD